MQDENTPTENLLNDSVSTSRLSNRLKVVNCRSRSNLDKTGGQDPSRLDSSMLGSSQHQSGTKNGGKENCTDLYKKSPQKSHTQSVSPTKQSRGSILQTNMDHENTDVWRDIEIQIASSSQYNQDSC